MGADGEYDDDDDDEEAGGGGGEEVFLSDFNTRHSTAAGTATERETEKETEMGLWMRGSNDRNAARLSNSGPRSSGSWVREGEGEGDIENESVRERGRERERERESSRSEERVETSPAPIGAALGRSLTEALPLTSHPIALRTAISALRFAIRNPLTNHHEVQHHYLSSLPLPLLA